MLARFQARGAIFVSLAKHLLPTSISVLVDNEQVVKDALAYLSGLGHRAIAYISGPALLTTAKSRLDGFKAALMASGLPFEPQLLFDGDYTYESGLRVANSIETLPVRPTAILASNDLMAIGCVVGLKSRGYRIPQDMSVMGIDDIAMAQVVDPPLTTISLPMYDLGALGMERLIQLRRQEAVADTLAILPHQLVVRASTASVNSNQFN
jgi:LacI family repressor for deo operon, udp, cdd, tsx, nupC, and nupG